MLFDVKKVLEAAENPATWQKPLLLAGYTYMVGHKLVELMDHVGVNDAAVFWISNGDYSAHELLIGMLQKFGPANVYISSYAFSEKPARVLADLKDKGIIKELYCVVDNRIDTRSASSLALLKNTCTKLKLIATHAKVTVLEFTEINKTITIVGSANYTENVRYEAGVITGDFFVSDFHISWIKKELNHGA